MNSDPFLSHGEQLSFKKEKKQQQQPKYLGRVVYDTLMNSTKCFYKHTFVTVIRNDINLNKILHISAQTRTLLPHIRRSRVFFSWVTDKIEEYPSLTIKYMNLVMRKPVFGVSDQVRHKPRCTAAEDG